VEGLALGAGFVMRSRNGRYEARAAGSYGFSDGAAKGSATIRSSYGLELSYYRQLRDISDVPAIAPLLNSISSQEFADDYGDYYLATGTQAAFRSGIGGRGDFRFSVTSERIKSQVIHATLATVIAQPRVRDDYFAGPTAATQRGLQSAGISGHSLAEGTTHKPCAAGGFGHGCCRLAAISSCMAIWYKGPIAASRVCPGRSQYAARRRVSGVGRPRRRPHSP
jgi:hypothetical protein